MKVVAICGSPRKNGNTETMLKRCLYYLQHHGFTSELILLGQKDIKGCRACGTCRVRKDKACAMHNDDFNSTFKVMLTADVLIVGSPVYFGSATPETMALLDRAGYVSRANGNLFSRKIGGPMVVARRAGHNFTFSQILQWYMINDMIVPGSTYWNIAFGREPGEVENDAEGADTIDRFSENIVWLANKIYKEDEVRLLH